VARPPQSFAADRPSVIPLQLEYPSQQPHYQRFVPAISLYLQLQLSSYIPIIHPIPLHHLRTTLHPYDLDGRVLCCCSPTLTGPPGSSVRLSTQYQQLPNNAGLSEDTSHAHRTRRRGAETCSPSVSTPSALSLHQAPPYDGRVSLLPSRARVTNTPRQMPRAFWHSHSHPLLPAQTQTLPLQMTADTTTAAPPE
jgi:hypothetical protein